VDQRRQSFDAYDKSGRHNDTANIGKRVRAVYARMRVLSARLSLSRISRTLTFPIFDRKSLQLLAFERDSDLNVERTCALHRSFLLSAPRVLDTDLASPRDHRRH